jgi:hypothetical protein
MERPKFADSLSITERMQKIRQRIDLENSSGISAANREIFLALCQAQEKLYSTTSSQKSKNQIAFDGHDAERNDFGNWHDYPVW